MKLTIVEREETKAASQPQLSIDPIEDEGR
jgi:hypothetical protein